MDRGAWRATVHEVTKSRILQARILEWVAFPFSRGSSQPGRGSLRTMHGGGSAPSCCAFTHRVAFEEGSGSKSTSNQLWLQRQSLGDTTRGSVN